MSRLMFAWLATGMLFAGAITNAACAADAILINFSSSRCMPCQAMMPVLAELERSGVPVRHVDVGSEPSVAARYGIRQTPTFVVLTAGQEVTRLVGMQTVNQLRQALATDPSGPLFATGAIRRRLDDIPAPQTRLAPIAQSRGNVPAPASPGNPSYASRSSTSETLIAASSANSAGQNHEPQGHAGHGEPMPNVSIADSIQRAEAATVRLRVHDNNGYGAGTGTIIDTHGEDALVLTCGHLFRDNEGKGKVEVDLFIGGQVRTVEGEVIDYDAENRDIALVAIRPGFAVAPVAVISDEELPRNGQTVFSFGCDRGDDPSRRDTRITGVNKYNQHLGASNLEIEGAPIDGRSGGGLFDERGRLVGVCNAADYKNDVGIYTGPGSVHWQLDRVNLAHLYKSGSPESLASVAPPTSQTTPPPNRIAALPGASPQSFGEPLQSAVPQPSELAGDQEVIVIVRDRNNPGATSQVMTLREPTADLMQMIQRHAR